MLIHKASLRDPGRRRGWAVLALFPQALAHFVFMQDCVKGVCVSWERWRSGSAVCVNSFEALGWKPRRLVPGLDARPPFTGSAALVR